MGFYEQFDTNATAIENLLKEAEEKLVTCQGAIDTSLEASQKLDIQIAQKQAELDVLVKSYDDKTKVFQKSLSELNDSETELSKKIITQVDTNAQLKLEQAKLEETNKKFREYEGKALKVLDAKDAELIAREKSLAERENMRPLTKTLLPER